MDGMVTEPGLNRDGRTLLYRAIDFIRRHGRPYPLSLDSDRRGAEVAAAGGYVAFTNPHFVRVTEKGEAYAGKLARCE
jgi:hypothetical protein